VVRAVLLVLFAGVAPLLGASWIRVTSPHFEIYTDTGEPSARRVLTRFEQARQIFAASTGWSQSGKRNILILLFGSEREFATLQPGGTIRGFYQSGPERDYIGVLAGADLDRILLHEYTHSVLNHAAAPLPQWFEEGLAELYSTLTIRGDRAIVGGPIAEHVAALNRSRWFTGAELGAIDKSSQHYNEAGKIGLFYAQSWALTHMLSFSKGYRERLPEYVEHLSAGEANDEAFENAFGKSMDAAVADLTAYSRLRFTGVEIEAPRSSDIVFSPAERLDPVTPVQARAEVLLLMERNEQARNLYEQAARRYPDSPVSQTGLAVLAVRQRDYEGARKLFERAMELGARDGSTYFEYAMLLRDTMAPAAAVHAYLEKTIQANPSHAEAHFLLGIRASDAGRFSQAVSHLRRAAQILPRQAYFWQALAFAYHKMGQTDDARTSALRALRAARTEHEQEMARSALNMIEAAPPPVDANKPAVTIPDSWKPPRGDASVSGDLVQVECDARPVRLHVRSEGQSVVLNVVDPRSVNMRGGAPRQLFPCGAQPPTPVLVEFVNATKQVTAIEFR
jgi:Flp pilus assembly protein TadD